MTATIEDPGTPGAGSTGAPSGDRIAQTPVDAPAGAPGAGLTADATTAFADLDAFVALPRTAGLLLSPDGTSLVVTVSTPDPKSQRYRSALWRVDPRGEKPAVRLTRGAAGESSAAFTSTGDLLFTAKRVDPDSTDPAEERSPLWLLPADGGEARMLASRAGGFSGIMTAQSAPVLLASAPVLPGAPDLAADDAIRKQRKDAGVSAILHQGYPVRFWDHDLGPDQPHLLTAAVPPKAGDRLDLRDLTPAPGSGLVETSSELSRDGRWVVTGWNRPTARGTQIGEIHLIEVGSGQRRVLRADDNADLMSPRFSPDGSKVAYIREVLSTPQRAVEMTVEVVTVSDGAVLVLGGEWDRWPSELAWLPDGSGLLVTADQDGRGPIFRLSLDGAVAQLTFDDSTYTDIVVAPDGAAVYALRTSYLAPAQPVRIALAGGEPGTAVPLPAPAPSPELPGTLVEVGATASDGVRVRGWLALPSGAEAARPAPLLLWIHGGPLGSWNAWSWRWTPWVMVAAGYAVLLPDPALSTGYGQQFVERGWGNWGGAPFTDLMAITDEVEQRPDIDAGRTAAMGGSFGGYMANWVAGHTDRFRAVVTHASLWSLEEFGGTTDAGYYWDREMSPEMMAENSPHRSVGQIRTPMLVIHGDKDYRVPIGQGLRLWYDLLAKSALPADADGRTPHRFLYFPSENHWVLTPGHAKVWYRVVLDFLAEHVLGQPPAELPSLLGGPPATAADGAPPAAAADGPPPAAGADGAPPAAAAGSPPAGSVAAGAAEPVARVGI